MKPSKATQNAKALCVKAEEELGRWFKSAIAKNEEAAEMYEKAATQYKIAKQFEEAGNCHVLAAKCHRVAKADYNECQQKAQAGQMYLQAKKLELGKKFFEEAVEMHLGEDRFSAAIKLTASLAEMHFQENKVEEAAEYYMSAADLSETDNKPLQRLKYLKEVGRLCGEIGQYKKSYKAYKEVCHKYLKTNVTRPSCRDLILRMITLRMADDQKCANSESIKDELETYHDLREAILLDSLLTAHEDLDLDAFDQAIGKYNDISPLDKWKEAIVAQIQENITNASGDGLNLNEDAESGSEDLNGDAELN